MKPTLTALQSFTKDTNNFEISKNQDEHFSHVILLSFFFFYHLNTFHFYNVRRFSARRIFTQFLFFLDDEYQYTHIKSVKLTDLLHRGVTSVT